MKIVGDLEADGFIPTATRIWCGAFEDLDTEEEYIFTPDNIDDLIGLVQDADLVVMHNLMGYDRLLIEKVYGYTIPMEKCWDTLIWSRLLNPDRKAPPGSKAPHSIEAWGQRFHYKKPVHEDWSKFSDEMLNRCVKDKDINKRVYFHLLQEMKK